MKKQTKAKKLWTPPASTEAQLAGLRASTSARRQATVERLQRAINEHKAKMQSITVQTIYEECGLRYAAIHRNHDALALFRANSTHLVAAKKRNKWKPPKASEIPPRDPLMNYKKPQLVVHLRSAQQQLLEAQQQQAVLVEATLKQEARIAELEAKLAELEPYRTFVEKIRKKIRQEEHDE